MERPNDTTFVTLEGHGIAELQHNWFVHFVLHVTQFFILMFGGESSLAPFSFSRFSVTLLQLESTLL